MTTQIQIQIAAIKGYHVAQTNKGFILVDNHGNPIQKALALQIHTTEHQAWLDCPEWDSLHHEALALWENCTGLSIVTDPASNGQLFTVTWSPGIHDKQLKTIKAEPVFLVDLPEQLAKVWYERELQLAERRSREIESLTDNIATLQARLSILTNGGN